MKHRKNLFRKQKGKELLYREVDIDFTEDGKFNKVSTQTYTFLSLLPKTILDLLQTFPFIWFVFLLTLSCTSYILPISIEISFALSIFFLFICKLIQNVSLTLIQRRHDNKLNMLPIAVFTGTDFSLIIAQELREGDLILIKSGETCPADCIILAVDSEINEAYVSIRKITGSEDYEKKKAVKETQTFVVYDGMNISELKERLEYVKIVHENPELQSVDGKIKVKGSPRVVGTTYENYLMAGSSTVECGWVLGLVVYSGNQSKRWVGLTHPLKSSKLTNLANLVFIFTFALLLAFVLFTSLLGRFYKGLKFGDKTIELVFNSIVLFGNLIPITLFISIEVMTLTKCFLINLNTHNFKVHNENALKSLGKIEYIVTEKTEVLTKDEIIVQACLVNQTLYLNGQTGADSPVESINAPDSLAGSSRELLKSHCESYESLKSDISNPACTREKWLLAVSLTICNNFMPGKIKTCVSADDEALFKFSQSLGLRLINQSDQSCELELCSRVYTFSIISYGDPSDSSVFKALIRENSSSEAIMIFRGPLSSMSYLIEDDEEAGFLEESSDSHIFKCLRKIVFGYKVMSSEEVKAFMLDYKKIELTTVNKKQRVLDVFDNHTQNLRLLALVGIDRCVDKGSYEALRQLDEAGVKVWICTSEDEESILATGHQFGILDGDRGLLKFANFNTAAEVLLEVRTALKDEVFVISGIKDLNERLSGQNHEQNEGKRASIRRNAQQGAIRRRSSLHPMLVSMGYGVETSKQIKKLNLEMINFVVAIDGKTFDLALRSHELLKNLMVLFFVAKSVLAYSFSAEQKKNLIRVMKENFDFKPEVMAIGGKYGNEKMLTEATIGVQVCDNPKKSSQSADICVNKFAVLPELLFEVGADYFNGFRSLLFLTVLKEVTVLTLLFLYQSLCSFSSCYLIEADLLVLYEFCISLIYIVAHGIGFGRPENIERGINYSSNFVHEARVALRYCVLMLYGLANGVLMFFFIVYGVGVVGNADGFTENSDTTGLVAFILINIIVYVFGLCLADDKIKAFLHIGVSFLVLMLILALGANGYLAYPALSSSSFTGLVSIWPLICIFSLVLFVLTAMFVESIKIQLKKADSRVLQYCNNIRGVFCDSSNLKYSKEDDDFELDKYSLIFQQSYREALYRTMQFSNSLVFFRVFLILITAVAVINNIFVAFELTDLFDLGIYTVIPTVFHLLMVITSFLIDHSRFIALNTFYFLSIVIFSITETFYNTETSTIGRYPSLCLLFCLILYSTWKYTIIKSVILFSVSIIVLIYEANNFNSNNLALEITLWVLLLLYIYILILVISYSHCFTRRQEYTLIQKAEIEVEKSATILSYLLPEFVRKRVKDGVRYIAEDKGTVSVIFCDICEFEKIMNLYSPQELLNLIDDIFGRLDMICETLGVTKIETVGKTYLACTGLKDSETNIDRNILKVSHARRAVEMALEVIKESSKIQLKDGSHLTFKIGVNSGPVTAGVVGFHKPQFSLVGDTVNTSSRMASTLEEPNSIQISAITYSLLEDTRGLVFKDFVREVKGKGTMETKVVSLAVQNIDEVVSEDLNVIFARRRSSVLNLNSTPTTVRMNSRRASDTMHIGTQPRASRNSLFLNLDIKAPSDLFRSQTSYRAKKFVSNMFRETVDETKLRQDHAESIKNLQKIGLVAAVTCNAALIITELVCVGFNYPTSSLFRLLILIFSEIGAAAGLKLLQKLQNKLKLVYYLSTLYTTLLILFFIESTTRTKDWVLDYMFISYFFLLLNFFSGAFFRRNIPFNIPAVGLLLAQVFRLNLDLPHIIYISSYIILILFLVFVNERKLKVNAVLKTAAEKELDKTKQLLTQMMPPHALASLEEGKEVTDRLKKVSMMYADIVGFTAWSSIRTPREVVGMLSELFTRFDRMSVENNVYKVHTIGDCYVAMGYIDDKGRNPAKEAVNVINFAIGLIQLIEETNEKCGIQLGMRIGIHTGDVIGGITGTRIVRYDIYGPDVLIANKMESNGEAGKIAVSESTKEIIEAFVPDEYKFVEAKEIKVPALGRKVQIYFAEKLKG